MTNKEKQAERILVQALGAELDPFLAEHEFVRPEGSVDYRRRCKDGDQFLRMLFEFRPKHHPGADSHIYPITKVVFPQLNRVAFDMVDHVPLLIGDPEITFSQPIDFAIPKEDHIRWYAHGREGTVECVRSIKRSLRAWVLPFLDEYTTIASLASAYEKHDERFGWQRPFYIYIAATYVILGQPEKAREVLEDRLGKTGVRRKYGKAFEFIAARAEGERENTRQ
jgi:hypothetical protein